MNRKRFLSSLAGIGTIAAPAFMMGPPPSSPAPGTVPPYLRPGDTVGITAPAGFITRDDIQPAVEQITSWGLKVRTGRTIGKRFFGFGGNDQERLDDLQQMLDDPSLKAVMCARGGYGVMRIIDRINFSAFAKNPKWIIGFSDITVLHAHLNRNFGIASLHSKMCNSFPDNWANAEEIQKATILSIRRALLGESMSYPFTSSPYNKNGTTEGVLVGGNLKMIESLAGTASDLYTNGKILFVEDTGEYLYSIDRMFWNLKRTGKLAGLKALTVGGFKIKPDDPGEDFGISLYDIVLDQVKAYQYPVCFDFPVGHQKNNFALKCGVRHRLQVGPASCTLQETT